MATTGRSKNARSRARARAKQSYADAPSDAVIDDVLVECAECGTQIPDDKYDYLCVTCRLALEDSVRQETEQIARAWTTHGQWEAMRQEAMQHGYNQAIGK